MNAAPVHGDPNPIWNMPEDIQRRHCDLLEFAARIRHIWAPSGQNAHQANSGDGAYARLKSVVFGAPAWGYYRQIEQKILHVSPGYDEISLQISRKDHIAVKLSGNLLRKI